MTIKVRFKVGNIEVDYEGSEDFLESKLPKLISDVTTLAEQVPAESDDSDSNGNTESGTPITLASFLKEKKVDSQNRRFLATAQWIHLKKGMDHIKTVDVTKALRDNQQTKIGNPSDCLNRNVSKGYCEKVNNNGFFVTDEGRNSLG